ncbi:MAG: hypothetical protein COW30_18655 [Rhodospirillales bacterium CG15_BIG_FIL_POST_REV_8_21_14_020_66_15]|nr:MAG: hypothetical protein COW30_18655 [Rhodospirillales bacterium CG15_BIG_FIL_POST_REV_8_21_14_020_66_15]
MARLLPLLSLALALALCLTGRAQARDITIDLTDPIVSITTGFTGTDLLLYGAVKQAGDLVVVVRGPTRDEVVRRKERVMGVWVNRDELVFDKVPSFYRVASNRPLKEFLNPADADRLQIGLANLDLRAKASGKLLPEAPYEFREGLIRNLQRLGLYMVHPDNVVFLSEQLFRTRLRFPANVSVGTFTIEVYLFKDGKLQSTATTLLTVRKFGIEAQVYDLAHRYSLAYGVLAVIIAVVAGWAANAAFRRG